jgi:hypothetical protein
MKHQNNFDQLDKKYALEPQSASAYKNITDKPALPWTRHSTFTDRADQPHTDNVPSYLF